MEKLKKLFLNFLETSTIHGLQYISTESLKVSRLLWTTFVIFGFSIAIYLISDSINSWEESPVSTSLDTNPISQVKFPEVTVCPPRGSNTALNYYIKLIKELGLSKAERIEALSLIWKSSKCCQTMMAGLPRISKTCIVVA